MIRRTIQCSVCGKQQMEAMHGTGWPGWGQLSGISLNNDQDPCFCPQHLALIASYADLLAGVDVGYQVPPPPQRKEH